jgi:hypothetical protein
MCIVVVVNLSRSSAIEEKLNARRRLPRRLPSVVEPSVGEMAELPEASEQCRQSSAPGQLQPVTLVLILRTKSIELTGRQGLRAYAASGTHCSRGEV